MSSILEIDESMFCPTPVPNRNDTPFRVRMSRSGKLELCKHCIRNYEPDCDVCGGIGLTDWTSNITGKRNPEAHLDLIKEAIEKEIDMEMPKVICEGIPFECLSEMKKEAIIYEFKMFWEELRPTHNTLVIHIRLFNTMVLDNPPFKDYKLLAYRYSFSHQHMWESKIREAINKMVALKWCTTNIPF